MTELEFSTEQPSISFDILIDNVVGWADDKNILKKEVKILPDLSVIDSVIFQIIK